MIVKGTLHGNIARSIYPWLWPGLSRGVSVLLTHSVLVCSDFPGAASPVS